MEQDALPASSLCKKHHALRQALGQVLTLSLSFQGLNKLQGWTFPGLFYIQKIKSTQKSGTHAHSSIFSSRRFVLQLERTQTQGTPRALRNMNAATLA